MDMSIMTVFDVIVLGLGIYLLVIGIQGYKEGTVHQMIVTSDELIKCKDIKAMSAYLMPKTSIFGGFCVIFGLQGLANDMAWIDFPQWVNVIFLIAFIICWLAFSYAIKKAKSTYIR